MSRFSKDTDSGRHQRGDHLLRAAREMSVGEMKGIRELNDRLEEVGTLAKTLEHVGHARLVRVLGQIAAVNVGQRAAGLKLVDPRDVWHACMLAATQL